MFKKSDNTGDKTPKQESKDHVTKAETATDKSAPKEDKSTPSTNENKSS